MNGSPERSFELEYRQFLQLPEILQALEVRWGPRYLKQIRLFNP
jgi:hypothetical protein